MDGDEAENIPRVQVLEVIVDELRRLFDALTSIYDSIKLKVLALIGGEIAFMPFVFSNFNFPGDLASIIFFSAGSALLSVSFALLLWAAATADWMIPLDLEETRKSAKRYPTKEDFLEYLREDYEKCVELCLIRIKKRAKAFNISLMLFAIGIVVLFVIKYTHGGQ